MADRVRTVFDRDGALSISVCGPVLLLVACGDITREYLLEATRVGRELGKSYPKSVGSLTVTSTDVPLPGAEIRALATKMSQESDAWVKCATTIVDGQGFKASVLRSMLVAMTVFQGGQPRRVFAEPDPAVEWLGNTLGLDPTVRAAVRNWAHGVLRR
jgi:hypothetical protein